MSKKNRAKMTKLPPANRTPRELGPAEFERYPENTAKNKLFTDEVLKRMQEAFKIPASMMKPPRPEYDTCGTTTEKHNWNGSNVCRKCGTPVGEAIKRTRAAQAEWDKQYGSTQPKTEQRGDQYPSCARDGHEWIAGVCCRCGASSATACEHDFDHARYCMKCGMSKREAAFQKSEAMMREAKAAPSGHQFSPGDPTPMTTELFARHIGAKAEYELTDIVHHIVVTPNKEPRSLSVTLHYDPARLGISPVEACMEIAGFMSQFDVMYEPLNVPCEKWATETTYSKSCDEPPPGYKDFTFTPRDMMGGTMEPSHIPFYKFIPSKAY